MTDPFTRTPEEEERSKQRFAELKEIWRKHEEAKDDE